MDQVHDGLAHGAVVAVVRELAGDAAARITTMRSASVIISGMSLEISRSAVPAVGELAQQLVHVGLGLDVDADGGLVDDQDLDAGGEPFGDADLLLVAAGEIADELGERGRADFQLRR